MIEALATEEVGRVSREHLHSMLAEMTENQPKYVRLCRLENCKQADQVKIVFSLDDKTLEQQILASFRMMGPMATEGSAPNGYVDEEISAWTDVLKG